MDILNMDWDQYMREKQDHRLKLGTDIINQYAVKTPTAFMCKLCSKEYDHESGLRLIGHLAKTECHDVDNCLLVPEDAQKQLRQAFNLSRKRDSISTDQEGPSGKRAPISTIGVHLLATEIVGKQFHEYIKDIWSCLMDDHVFRIGIHGIGGVGKTEVARYINNKLLETPNKFHHVFWVNMSPDWSYWNPETVSPPRTVHKLQSSISKAVGVDLSDGDDESKRAAQLSKGLAEKKKSVLILDDVWDCISLQEAGVPVGVDQCTVVFTTRSLEVCRQLGCQRKIEIRCLLPDESYELFKKNLGKETTLSKEVEEISRSAVDRYVGLPLAITIMTGNMKGSTDICQWRNALKKVDMEIFQKLKTSYDYLKDPTLQHCFLYCPLLVRDGREKWESYAVARRRLAEYLVDERIIKRMNSRREELDEALTMLNILRDAGLLEITSWNVVKMNALIRSMALQIMEESQHRTMIKNCLSLKEFPDEESWTGDLVRVSLEGNEFENIPLNYSPSCSKLSTLLMGHNRKLGCIGGSFFEGMPALKVLDLSYTGIESLPSSVCDLVNLTTLLLKVCSKLRRIPSVAKLRALKKLDLFCTPVEVPEGIEMLSKLTYLDLYHTQIEELKPGIFAEISHLQFLRLPWSLPVKGEELGCLSRLETLTCSFYDVAELNKYLIHLKGGFKEREPPIRLDFRVGPGPVYTAGFANLLFYDDEDVNAEEDQDLSRVVLYNCNINEVDMPIYFQEIDIVKCNEARSLCNFSPIKGASELKYISIRDCDGLELLCSSSLPGQVILENLEYMELSKLKNLSVLFSKEVNAASYGGSCFSNLTRFFIQGCPSIKRLFPFHLLPNLERLCVSDCLLMEELFAAEEKSNTGRKYDIWSLSRLCIFWLKDLPKLKSVCAGRFACHIPKSCSVKISSCPKLLCYIVRLDNRLSKGQGVFPPEME